jgi:hypothetical protein
VGTGVTSDHWQPTTRDVTGHSRAGSQADRAGPDPADNRGQHAVVHGERDVAVEIRASHRHAEPRHLTQQYGRGMAIVVVESHADHADPGVRRRQERRVRVRRAVVRNLQDVGAQVDTGGEDLALFLDLGVARQQDPYSVHGRAHHQ